MNLYIPNYNEYTEEEKFRIKTTALMWPLKIGALRKGYWVCIFST